MVTLAKSLVKDLSAAEDIASNSFLALLYWRNISALPPKATSSLLMTFTRNVTNSYIFSKRIEFFTKDHNNVGIFQDPGSIKTKLKHPVIKSFNQLSLSKKKAIELMIAGYTNHEIARIMGLTENNITKLQCQAQKQLKRALIFDNEYPLITPYKQPETREQIIKIQGEVNDEFIKYYTKNPHKLYNVSPRQYEKFVAELLKDMGYEVWLNNHTRDGGRDIIAVLKTPSKDSIVTIVKCKKYSLDNPVPIEIVERFMYTIREKDKANAGWIVTTSIFSREAQKCQHNYNWLLKLKDNTDLAAWCSNYGKWKRTSEGGGLWLPDNPLG